MSDILTHSASTLELADRWEDEAEAFESYEPGSQTARTLRKCADTLRRVADRTAPDEVPLTAIRDRTGWSPSWLHRRVQELEAEGLARKRGGAWYVQRAAALRIPVKRGHRPDLGDAGDIDELSDRILDMSTP